MDNFFEKVKNQQDPFKKLISYIPGFGGYVERQTQKQSAAYGLLFGTNQTSRMVISN